ncbi:MAG: FHA domain-containing protein [Synergistes sp.]|nr:FHA domain-containing protein [Synergistes sp.]
MGKAEKRRITVSFFAVMLSCFLLLSPTDTAEAGSYTLKLRQFLADFPSATAYFEVKDANGNIVTPSGNVVLNISDKSMQPENVRPFSRKDEGIAIVFLVDVSSSVSQRRFAELKNAMCVVIKQLKPKDKVAVVSVGEQVNVCQDYTSETKTLLYTVQQLKARDSQTSLNSGVISALKLAGIKNTSLPKRRMVILASDGMDDSASSATAAEVRDAIDETHVPIYTLFYDDAKKKSSLRDKEAHSVGEYARRSGGTFYDLKAASFADVFKRIFSEEEKISVAEFNVSDAVADGRKVRASLVYSDGTVDLSEGIDVRLLKPIKTETYTVSEDSASSDKAESEKGHGEGAEEGGVSGIVKDKRVLFGIIAVIAVIIAGAAVLIFKNGKAKKHRAKKGEDREAQSDDEASVTQSFTAAADHGSTMKIYNDPATVNIRGNMAAEPVKTGPAIDVELSVTGSRGSADTYRISVCDRLVLGRKGGKGADFGIPGDATISARHCELIFANGKLSVSDLNSTNGTYVNGVPIRGVYTLNDGDRLTLGKTEFKIKIIGVR